MQLEAENFYSWAQNPTVIHVPCDAVSSSESLSINCCTLCRFACFSKTEQRLLLSAW